jgi:hypothetical protein
MFTMKFIACFLFAAFAAGIALPVATSAQQYPTVTIDGSPMGFVDQPPVERSGRIYVPMRAIFERLGATVVYDRGTINATRNERTIQLQIGSPVAMVNGSQVQLDSPPFEIAGRTLVPLRFVSQALGARVSWDQNRNTAYIMTANGGGYNNGGYNNGGYNNGGYNNGGYNGANPPPWDQQGHVLLRRPQPWSATPRYRPFIAASFVLPLRPYSVRVRLDGQDVTGSAQVTANGFSLTPDFRLSPGMHTVSVFAVTLDGRRLHDEWSFRVL